ncbi:hypothetical protein CDAR_470551 [Caerostris darwini]|uniref:Uncharacterized protein n=1 Tax=Caerostris darwini TaxID=1538125 RepID=A0AAV4VGE9_9ARAC|nr:hypothetical protein CDAR_470551 [Caerostris darwini]
MPRKEQAMSCKKLLSKGPQKRHKEIGSESSEDRRAGLETIGERRSEETEHHFQLSLERNDSCQTRQQRRQRRLERDRFLKSQARQRETPEQRESRLLCMRLLHKRVREAKTQEHRMARLEKCRKIDAQKKNGKKNSKDVTPVEPAFVIKGEPIELDPEPSTSAEIVIQNANEDAFRVEPAIVIKEEPIQFDPQPSASADIVIKDEFIVSNEDYTGCSALVPPSTEPTSHVTLSVACLGSRQQPDNGR